MNPNVEKLRHAYQAWHDSRGTSVPAWMDLIADDLDMRSIADGAPGMEFSAPRRGRAEVEHYFAGLARDWEMIFYSADEFIAEGDRVVVLGRCRYRFKATGKEVESPIVNVWRFRDGKAVEFFETYDTARALAATRPG
jgi:ketosteroid isomerase-like protein